MPRALEQRESSDISKGTLDVEGMELSNREDILIADESEDFAQGIVELYESEDLWNRISKNGITKTRALYSTDTARKKLEVLFSDEHLRDLGDEQQSHGRDIALAVTS
ncbi:unnamed protein product [uncultured bacterium]|jgi:hypothetical protein|nr:unnamed protein product [uncultured bacterium]